MLALKRHLNSFWMFFLILSILGLNGTVTGCRQVRKDPMTQTSTQEKKKMVFVGHRGAAGLAPENTLASFKKALEFGVDGLEMDVLISADGEVMVHHDFTLKPEITRTVHGQWLLEKDRKPIKDMTLSELKTYDVGRLKTSTIYARRYPDQKPADGERIPTFLEVIGLLKSRKDTLTSLWVEIKTSPEKPELTPEPGQVVEAVAAVLKSEGFLMRSRILSFDWRALVYCLKHHPEIPVIFLSYSSPTLDNVKSGRPGPSPWTAGIDVDDFMGSVPKAIHHLGGKLWGPQFRSLTADELAEAHGLGIQVFPWVVDDKDDMDILIRMGVDGIITNRPDIYRSLIEAR
jgi:glycerophosphoryl diester phosphodiesterase